MRSARRLLTTTLWSTLVGVPLLASGQGTLEDYRRSASINQRVNVPSLTVGLVNGGVNWVGNSNQAWYRVSVRGGNQFVLVDADAWTKAPAFDHARLATALSTAANGQYTAITLPFQTFEFTNNRQGLQADIGNSRYSCTLTDYTCTRGPIPPDEGGQGPGGGPAGFGRQGGGGRGGLGGAGADGPQRVVSPDSTKEAFIQNYNIAIRPFGTAGRWWRRRGLGRGGRGWRRGWSWRPGAATNFTLLSTDGSEGDAYLLHSIEWSPDSKKLVAYRQKPGYNRVVNYVRSSPTDQVQPRDTAINVRGSPAICSISISRRSSTSRRERRS